jgi:prepilin-type N-terminal cleavage/methylation domain-containing protein
MGSLRRLLASRHLRSTDDGYTLVELIVVIVIIGTLSALTIPNFFIQRQKGSDTATRSDLRALATAQRTYGADLTSYATCSGAAACKNSSALGGYGYRGTTGVKIAAAADGSNGFCAAALSTTGKYFLFDSENGGLASYNSTTAPTAANDGLSTGACANVTTYPIPAS